MNRTRPAWLANWRERHRSPVSFWLHLVGIPLTLAAVALAAYQLHQGRWDLWWRPALLLALGYGAQIVGHRHEGNDAGEWILIKRLLGRPYVAVSPRFRRPQERPGGARRGKAVAVIGASRDRSKFGNKSVRAHLRQGWDVYPVNPRGGVIEGLPAYKSLEAIPVKLDRVTLYVPAAAGLALLPAIAHAKPVEFFVNPGAESDELLARAAALGLAPIVACSIRALGEAPADFPP